jgi:hypothetical protein
MMELPKLIADKVKVPLDSIYLVQDGKKIKATDAPIG